VLQSIKKLDRCKVEAADGEVGHVDDIYFDDEKWVVRYLVIDTGGWLVGRSVLISPYAVERVDVDSRIVATNLTRAQIEGSPDIDTAKPISRQHEAEYHRYYGYPEYWPYTTYWAWGGMPSVTPPDTETLAGEEEYEAREVAEAAEVATAAQQDRLRDSQGASRSESQSTRQDSGGGEGDSETHLRSGRELVGDRIRASDDFVGYVEDILFDEDSWAIRYLIVHTREWLPGRRVLVAPGWVRDISWMDEVLHVDLTRSAIEKSPEFDPKQLPSREYERSLHRHYSRRGYWE
jgi:hypothetical protein